MAYQRPPWVERLHRTGYGIMSHHGERPAAFAKPKVRWARVSHTGRVHRVQVVIIRWGTLGGTWEKPYVTACLACGGQYRLSQLLPAAPEPGTVCARCEKAEQGKRTRRAGE